MAETIDGALIAISADLGANRPPFVLDRDLLDAPTSLLTPTVDALTDLTAQVIALDATWGAATWDSPLTGAEAGGATLELWDPDRLYDPGNPDLVDPPRVGRVVVWSVDGTTIQTLKIGEITHELAGMITTIEAIDALAEASRQGVTVQMVPNPVNLQAQQLAAVAGWGPRVTYEGSYVTARAQDVFTGNLLEALQRLSQAELGYLHATPDGGIRFRARGVTSADSGIVLGTEPGVGATERTTGAHRNTINAVYITPIDPAFGVVVFRDQASISLAGGEVAAEVAEADLLLTGSDPYRAWATDLLNMAGRPRPTDVLGTLLPTGSEVAALLALPFGARVTIQVPAADGAGMDSRPAEVMGVALHVESIGGWEVTSISRDVVA